MNFFSVKETVERARIKAAQAAKKLSLNEMAKNDEYIHSEGLKIKNKHHNNNSSNHNRMKKKLDQDNNYLLLREIDESSTKNHDNSVVVVSSMLGRRQEGCGSNRHGNRNHDDDHDDDDGHNMIHATRTTKTNRGTDNMDDTASMTSNRNNPSIHRNGTSTSAYLLNHRDGNGDDDDDDDDDDDSVDSYEQEHVHDPILQYVKQVHHHHDNTNNNNNNNNNSKDRMINENVGNKSTYNHHNNKDSLHFMQWQQQQIQREHEYKQRQQRQQQQESKKKDPNRFMSDLDARLSTPNTPSSYTTTTHHQREPNQHQHQQHPSRKSSEFVTPSSKHYIMNSYNNDREQQYQQHQPQNNKIFESFTKAENKLNWLRDAVASPKLQESLNNVMKQVPGMNNNSNKYDHLAQSEHNNDIEMGSSIPPPPSSSSKKIINISNNEKITVTTSSSLAILNQNENEELQRLHQLMNKSKRNVCFQAVDMIEKHRNYCLVVITFILTLVGYWYSRKKNEENVT